MKKYLLIIAVTLIPLMPMSATANERQLNYMVQIMLNGHGYNVGEPDGIVGRATRSALSAFADTHGSEASVTGFVNYAMRANLQQRIPIEDETLLDMIRRSASTQLRDPDSAQFRNIYEIQGPSISGTDTSTYVCGQINGRNAYGGYAGFTDFMGFKIGPIANVASIDGPDDVMAGLICSLAFIAP